MTETDAGAASAIALLDSAITTAYTALRDLGLGPDPAREAILCQVADTITVVAAEIDGTADDDEGGVRTR